MLSSIGRAAIRRGGADASYSSTNRAAQSIWSLQRVTFSQGANESSTRSAFAAAFSRSYATATKTVTKINKTTSTKAKPKTKTAAKAKAKAKAKKPVKKAAKKPAKKKAAKPKAKKTRKPVKKVLTDDQKERVALKVLKQKALSPPTALPESAWMVLLRENRALAKEGEFGGYSTTVSTKYKALSPEEKESLNQIANDNKTANQVAHSKWLQTYTPEQIKEANNARSLLKRKYKKSGAKMRNVDPIVDPRLPKRPAPPMGHFLKDRYASGDFKGIKISDAGKLISQEWKNLQAGERKVYEDRANVDKQRYIQEFKTVFHRDSSATV